MRWRVSALLPLLTASSQHICSLWEQMHDRDPVPFGEPFGDERPVARRRVALDAGARTGGRSAARRRAGRDRPGRESRGGSARRTAARAPRATAGRRRPRHPLGTAAAAAPSSEPAPCGASSGCRRPRAPSASGRRSPRGTRARERRGAGARRRPARRLRRAARRESAERPVRVHADRGHSRHARLDRNARTWRSAGSAARRRYLADSTGTSATRARESTWTPHP